MTSDQRSVEERYADLEAAVRAVLGLSYRLHPVAGYMFASDPRKILLATLEKNA